MSKVSLGQLDAPCILYNLSGYYDSLKALLAKMIEKGLSTPQRQQGIRFAANLEEITINFEMNDRKRNACPAELLFISFSQCSADICQHLLAQQHKSLLGASGRNIRAMHILTGKEVFTHRAGSGTGVTEEVGARQSKPLFQSSRVKARADGGVEQHLACTQLCKIRPCPTAVRSCSGR